MQCYIKSVNAVGVTISTVAQSSLGAPAVRGKRTVSGKLKLQQSSYDVFVRATAHRVLYSACQSANRYYHCVGKRRAKKDGEAS